MAVKVNNQGGASASPSASEGAATDTSEPTVQVVKKFKLGFAPAGEANAAFYHNGEPFQVVLQDGEYVLPEDLDDDAEKALIQSLIKGGFTQAYVDVDPNAPVAAAIQPKVIRYTLEHPDNTDGNVIDGVAFKVTVDGAEVEAAVIGGKVDTTDTKLMVALGIAGFRVTSATEE